MNVYVVREIESKVILGIFWAETEVQLVDVVDANANPFRHEYAKLNNGGILFPKSSVKVPFVMAEDDEWIDLADTPVQLSENTDNELSEGLDGEKLRWVKFEKHRSAFEAAIEG